MERTKFIEANNIFLFALFWYLPSPYESLRMIKIKNNGIKSTDLALEIGSLGDETLTAQNTNSISKSIVFINFKSTQN